MQYIPIHQINLLLKYKNFRPISPIFWEKRKKTFKNVAFWHQVHSMQFLPIRKMNMLLKYKIFWSILPIYLDNRHEPNISNKSQVDYALIQRIPFPSETCKYFDITEFSGQVNWILHERRLNLMDAELLYLVTNIAINRRTKHLKYCMEAATWTRQSSLPTSPK